MMKSFLLVVFLAAAATAAVVSNKEPDAELVPERVDGDEVADVDGLSEVLELSDIDELIDETAIESRRNLNLGFVSFTDRLIHNEDVRANAVAGQVLTRDIRVNFFGTITAIRVNQLGPIHSATPSILNGGVGTCCVTIRIRTVAGHGYHYRVEVYARS